MARKEKLLSKLLEQPKTFSYRELKTVLESIGFEEVATGKTSGSAVAFIKKVMDTYADEDD